MAPLASRVVFLVGALLALLELVGRGHRLLGCSWEGAPRRVVVQLLELFLASDQAAAVRDVADRRGVRVLVPLELGQQLVGVRREA